MRIIARKTYPKFGCLLVDWRQERGCSRGAGAWLKNAFAGIIDFQARRDSHRPLGGCREQRARFEAS